MRRAVIALLVATLLSVVGLAGAQSRTPPPIATLELSEGSVAAGIGFSWGSGTLTYQGGKYPVRVQGLSVGEVGIARATTQGASLKAAASGLRLTVLP